MNVGIGNEAAQFQILVQCVNARNQMKRGLKPFELPHHSTLAYNGFFYTILC